MRGLAVLVLLLAGGVAIRALWQPPDPRVIPSTVVQPAGDAAARGRLVYERYGCAMCHGADGKGGFSNPNSETDGKVPAVVFVKEGYTATELAALIRNGVPRIGRGDPAGRIPPFRMPGWHDRMSGRDLDDLVQYLMSLYPLSATEKWR